MNWKKVKKYSWEYVQVTLFGIIMALSYKMFINPNNFASAGIAGIGVMIEHLFPKFSLGYFSLIVNVPLCIFAIFCVSRGFGIKSFLFCVVYSVAYLLLGELDLSGIIYDAKGTDTIFPCILGGLVSGFIYAMSFRINSSTGGNDVIAKYVSIKKPLLNYFWVSFAMNCVIAICSYFVFGEEDPDTGLMIYNWKPVCLCLLYSFVANAFGNMLIKGSNSAYKFTIITKHADEIDAEIVTKLHHGATRVEATGVFSNSEMEMIVCVVNKHQIVEFKRILKKYDQTFTFIEDVGEVVGNFKKIK